MNSRKWVADRLNKLRGIAGLSKTEWSGRAEVERHHLRNILHGKPDIKVSTLFRLVEAAGYEVVELRVRKRV